jgi:streptomycin 6-kinase
MDLFRENMLSLYGKKGSQWFDDLPHTIKKMEKLWNLSGLKPVDNLSYNYVLSGFQGQRPVILKLSLDELALKKEMHALMALEGYGVVKVLDEVVGALLLERAISGVSLRSYYPDKEIEAINIASDVMQRLHRAPLPAKGEFLTLADWLSSLDKNWNIPSRYLDKARNIKTQLLATAAKPVLLHGDLHHDNILQHEHTFLIIDPKGVIGEPAYEVAAFIRNPIPELLESNHVIKIIENRVACFAELQGLHSQRIWQWCFVQAVLAWAWSLEDQMNPDFFNRLTSIFDQWVV